MPPRLTLDGQVHQFDLALLDCDGVIFDMNRAKTEGFRHALASYPPPDVERLVEHHRALGGVSRYEKLDHFFREIHPVAEIGPAKAEVLRRYRRFVQKAYRRTQPIEKAMDFTRYVRGAGGLVHVVSGSDEDGLHEVFRHHGIRSAFDGLHGSPTTKEVHVRRLLEETGVTPDRALFVGDGRSDFESARAFGVPFVFLAEHSEWKDALDHLAAWDRATAFDGWPSLLESLDT